jgi:nitroreductase
METLEAIFTRRSIRKFLATPVEEEKIEILLRAAMSAPSAVNEQPWAFIVLTDRDLFAEIMRVHPYAAMLKTAPLAILVCGDLAREKAPGNWPLDCANATENLLLAAHASGLGAVWCGVYPEPGRMRALAALLHLPREILPFALIASGYADGQAAMPAERFSFERVHRNDWSRSYREEGG